MIDIIIYFFFLNYINYSIMYLIHSGSYAKKIWLFHLVILITIYRLVTQNYPTNGSEHSSSTWAAVFWTFHGSRQAMGFIELTCALVGCAPPWNSIVPYASVGCGRVCLVGSQVSPGEPLSMPAIVWCVICAWPQQHLSNAKELLICS